MSTVFKSHRSSMLLGGIVIVLLIGICLGLAWRTPAYAVATDRQENFAMATGFIENDMEAVVFLDTVNGKLTVWVLNNRGNNPLAGKFTVTFEHNVLADFKVDGSKAPKFLMVTGMANFPSAAGGVRWGNCVIYVTEITSGKMVAYGIPWVSGSRTAPPVGKAQLVKLDEVMLRQGIVRQ